MNPRTELVMDRHRALKAQGLSGLEASRVVLREAEAGTLGVKHESPQDVPTPTVPTEYVPVPENCACGRKREPRRTVCAACRKKAYRERSK